MCIRKDNAGPQRQFRTFVSAEAVITAPDTTQLNVFELSP